MSIGIVFRCQDGIVLAADREISDSYCSYYQCKLSSIGIKDFYLLMTQAASDADDMPTIHEKLWEKLGKTHKSIDEIRRDVEAVLKGFKKWPTGKYEHESLIALVPNPSELVIWKTSNAKVSSMLQTAAIIGAGNSPLTQYLLSLLTVDVHQLSMQRAAIYAIYIIKQAKKFIPGCGGSGTTDVIRFPKATGIPDMIPNQFVDEMEEVFESLERQASSVFSALIDSRSNEAYNALVINQLTESVRLLPDKAKMFKTPQYL